LPTRYLYLARHGSADPFGALTPEGHDQARLLGRRLAHLPIDAVWHSPLPRAETSARIVAEQLAGAVPVHPAEELVDHVPYVPPLEETPPAWVPFFDGYDPAQAAAGRRTAGPLAARVAPAPVAVPGWADRAEPPAPGAALDRVSGGALPVISAAPQAGTGCTRSAPVLAALRPDPLSITTVASSARIVPAALSRAWAA